MSRRRPSPSGLVLTVLATAVAMLAAAAPAAAEESESSFDSTTIRDDIYEACFHFEEQACTETLTRYCEIYTCSLDRTDDTGRPFVRACQGEECSAAFVAEDAIPVYERVTAPPTQAPTEETGS